MKRDGSSQNQRLPNSRRDASTSRELSEKQIEKAVTRFFPEILALKTHVRAWPDHIFFFPDGVAVFMEFKRSGKALSVHQRAAFETLKDLGFPVYLADDIDQGIEILRSYLVRS